MLETSRNQAQPGYCHGICLTLVACPSPLVPSLRPSGLLSQASSDTVQGDFPAHCEIHVPRILPFMAYLGFCSRHVLKFETFLHFGRTTLLRKLAVGSPANALDRGETAGCWAASGQRYGSSALPAPGVRFQKLLGASLGSSCTMAAWRWGGERRDVL